MVGRIIVSLMMLALSLTAAEAGSPVKFGFKGGIELTSIDHSDELLKDNNRSGFYIGPTLGISLPLTGLGIDVSLLYNQRTLKGGNESFKQKSLLLPANIRYGVSLGEAIGIFAAAGPQFTFNVGDDVLHWYDDQLDENKHFNMQNTLLSFNFGIGMNIGPHLEAGVFYNIPTGKTGDFTWDKLGDELKSQTWKSAKTRTNAWHISVSYFF